MPHNSQLEKFVQAQQGTYDSALAELQAGRKRTHWMWFIFPQLTGLGMSPMARHYAIASLAEARAYLQHPLLGRRLQKCTSAVIALTGPTAYEIFGSPDDLKFRSSMTLFSEAAVDTVLFNEALERYYAGVPDPRTLALLAN